MARQGKRDLAKERFWRRALRQWQRSGLSVRAYCAEHDLTEALFYAWRRVSALAQEHDVEEAFEALNVEGGFKKATNYAYRQLGAGILEDAKAMSDQEIGVETLTANLERMHERISRPRPAASIAGGFPLGGTWLGQPPVALVECKFTAEKWVHFGSTLGSVGPLWVPYWQDGRNMSAR